MPFDGLVLSSVCNELENKLAGGRIERVYQPGKVELQILIYKPGPVPGCCFRRIHKMPGCI